MIDFSIRNPLIVNLLLALVLLVGLMSWHAMPQEMFPVVEQDRVQITTLFEGAGPEEIERQITLPLEQELDGLIDIDSITSTSSEGSSRILIRLKSGADANNFLRDAQNAIDQVIPDLPAEAEEPIMKRLETRFPVISVGIYGDVSRDYLYQLAERVKRELAQIKDVASVGVAGDREWELWVVVDPDQLAARRVGLTEVAQALSNNLRDLPGGSLTTSEGDIRLRGLGVEPDPDAVSQIVVRSVESGAVLLLGELARVELRFEEVKTLGRFQGKPSVNLTISKTAAGSTIDVAARVRDYVAELQQELPPGVGIGLFQDLSIFVKTRLDTVISSGVVGLVLVLASLYLLLNFRIAGITALGIPVSFLTGVIFIHYTGYSINMVSLFAFLVALGLVVDDAIIVTENVYRHIERGMAPREAASLGAKEVFWPVMASTTTTIAAFLPMFAIGGTMGAFIAVIPVVVTASLLGSLFEAFAILPSHSAEWLRKQRTLAKQKVDHWAELNRYYLRLLRHAVAHRYHTALLTLGALLILVVFALTRIPFLLFGSIDTGQFFINVEMPNTYSLEESSRVAAQLESVIHAELHQDELDTLLTNVGIQFIDFNQILFGNHYIQLIVDLKKEKPRGFIERFVAPVVNLKFSWEGTRERETEDIINSLRDQMQEIAGIRRLAIMRAQAGPGGADLEIGIVGQDITDLRLLAERVSQYARSIPGVYDVRHDMEAGKLEYRYALNARGKQLGITQQQLANAVRTGFLGLEVTRVNWRDKSIPVRLIYDEPVRYSDLDLALLPIVLDDGRQIYLGDVADISKGRGFNSISRRDLERLAIVTADVDATVITPNQAIERITQAFPGLTEDKPDYRLLFLGQRKETAESLAGMKQAMWIALGVIFFILAALFRSLLDPLVVMFAIPFGFIGVILGHIIFGEYLQFLSLIGFLALSGIVVNDSLLLIDFARRLRCEGMAADDAMIEAGRMRIRPILLTTITTFLGVSPLIFFSSGQTAFLAPMAISLGFGLLFATVLILVALPCFYLIADDLRSKTFRFFGKDPRLCADAPAPTDLREKI